MVRHDCKWHCDLRIMNARTCHLPRVSRMIILIAMKTIDVFLVATAIAISDVAACDKIEILGWTHACDRFRSVDEKCDSRRCRYSLSQLTKRETLRCYVKLGMGRSSDLEKYMNLAKAC